VTVDADAASAAVVGVCGVLPANILTPNPESSATSTLEAPLLVSFAIFGAVTFCSE